MSEIKHEGLHVRRLADPFNGRERAFSELWTEENAIRRTGRPDPLLAELLTPLENYPESFTARLVCSGITQDHATAAATVIQWLGSNVGMSFLSEALGKCGYVVKRKTGKD